MSNTLGAICILEARVDKHSRGITKIWILLSLKLGTGCGDHPSFESLSPPGRVGDWFFESWWVVFGWAPGVARGRPSGAAGARDKKLTPFWPPHNVDLGGSPPPGVGMVTGLIDWFFQSGSPPRVIKKRYVPYRPPSSS